MEGSWSLRWNWRSLLPIITNCSNDLLALNNRIILELLHLLKNKNLMLFTWLLFLRRLWNSGIILYVRKALLGWGGGGGGLYMFL